jgi:hypothetical protein
VRVREILLASSLIVLILAEARSFRRWELKKRALLLPRIAGLSVEAAEQDGSLYEFDREFGRFLEGVRQTVPTGSSVAVSLPSTTTLYLYTAHYALAPRQVFQAGDGAAADFLAVYGQKTSDGTGAAWAVPGGTVRRLR